MLTVLTWLWKQEGGRTNYSAVHVNIWAAMVRRHLTLPHEIACVTDMPEGIDESIRIIPPPGEFEDVRIPTWGEKRAPGLPQCFRRIAMFRPDAAGIFGEHFVSMDLDCVISASLDPLFDHDHDFRMYRGTTMSRPYNGSMLQMKAGARPHVYTDFTPEGAVLAGEKYLGSDQAWISHALGFGEATWGVSDGVLAYGSQHNSEAEVGRVTFFLCKSKPWDLLDDPFVAEHYRGSRKCKALILGRTRSVWDEAEAALDRDSFDGVIALDETACHWPGRVDAIAESDDHAVKLAAMLGFADWTFCGRSAD